MNEKINKAITNTNNAIELSKEIEKEVRNQSLVVELKEARNNLITAWSRLKEFKSQCSEGHHLSS